jgi:hypothetical protein
LAVTTTKAQRMKYIYNNPFEFLDNVRIAIKGNNLNIFQKYTRLQTTALGIVGVSIVAWIIMGFDSNPLQLVYGGWAAINQLGFGLNHADWSQVAATYNYYYGKEMHWSAFLLYGLMYYILSKNFAKVGIVKSKNVSYSIGVTALAIALFEFYWMGSFAYFQNQSWIITMQMPQFRIILQNIMFLSAGVIASLYCFVDSFVLKDKEIVGRLYKLRVDWIAAMLVISSIAVAVLWWYYPWNVQQLSVTLLNGNVWHNSNNFPQTLYTIKTDPTGLTNAGTWYWIQDNSVHALNTIVKAVWSATIAYVFLVKKVK